MTDDDQIGAMLCGSLQDPIGRVADEHVRLQGPISLLCLAPQTLEQPFVASALRWRSEIITIVMVGAPPPFRAHVVGALRSKWSLEQACEPRFCNQSKGPRRTSVAR
jgi:hypothetical protein